VACPRWGAQEVTNTLEATGLPQGWEGSSRVLVTSWATQRGQATLPNLEIGKGAARVLGAPLGNTAGASHEVNPGDCPCF
jgi:hypothetical protein